MKNDSSQPKLAEKCVYVVMCGECGYNECYDSLLLAQSSALKHSRQRSHIRVATYNR